MSSSGRRTSGRIVPAVFALALLAPGVIGKNIEFYVLWGANGRYDGGADISKGRFVDARPYSFEFQYSDEWKQVSETRVEWRSGVANGVDGVHFVADLAKGGEVSVKAGDFETTFSPEEPTMEIEKSVPIANGNFIVVGPGDPAAGPRGLRKMAMPEVYRPPTPTADAISLPQDWAKGDKRVAVRLSSPPPGPIEVRRGARGDGRLYLELFSEAGPLNADAEVLYGGERLGRTRAESALWLALRPRVDTLAIEIAVEGSEESIALEAPTTLVETRGSRLFVNGEPYLVKGTLPRNMNAPDAAFLKSLSANTIRAREAGLAEKYGFMRIASAHRGPGRLCERFKNKTDPEFFEDLDRYLERMGPNVPPAVKSPSTIIVQVGNEQVTGGDPWMGRLGETRPFERLDVMLARLYNYVKPMDPMLPVGYSNCAFGYIVPDFMDVYLHNTYLENDRRWPPIEAFMSLQGCDRRPYIHTEFGANVYMPQPYLRAPNIPVYEKIHAWNYPNRWNNYLEAGTAGGTCYCMYDYDYSKVHLGAWDKGFTNFGIMTWGRKPKLACWELWHLWRDFKVSPSGADLEIRYLRDYTARNCRLDVVSGGTTRTVELENFAPRSTQKIAWPFPDDKNAPREFRWRMTYDTHSGVDMLGMGAWPAALEEADFLSRLDDRETSSVLRELLTAEAIDSEGNPAPPTLMELERKDGLGAIGFRKSDGTIYMTYYTRQRPAEGAHVENVALDLGFTGEVTALDPMTGKPMERDFAVERLDGGRMRWSGLRVPFLARNYTGRSHEALSIPFIRVKPSKTSQ